MNVACINTMLSVPVARKILKQWYSGIVSECEELLKIINRKALPSVCMRLVVFERFHLQPSEVAFASVDVVFT